MRKHVSIAEGEGMIHATNGLYENMQVLQGGGGHDTRYKRTIRKHVSIAGGGERRACCQINCYLGVGFSVRGVNICQLSL